MTGRLRLRGSYRLRPDKIGIVLEGRNRKTLYETSIATVERNTSLVLSLWSWVCAFGGLKK